MEKQITCPENISNQIETVQIMSEYKFKINGKEYSVTVNSIEGTNANVTVNGVGYDVEIESGAPAQAPAAPVAAPATVKEQKPAAQAAPAGGAVVKSPLPGVIVEVSVKKGQSVKRGQKVAVLEAMKMENEILSPSDGTVSAVHVSKGDSILEGANVVTIS